MSKASPTSMMMSGSMTSRYIFVTDESKVHRVCRGLKGVYPELSFSVPAAFARKRISVRDKSGLEISEPMFNRISQTASKLEEQ